MWVSECAFLLLLYVYRTDVPTRVSASPKQLTQPWGGGGERGDLEGEKEEGFESHTGEIGKLYRSHRLCRWPKSGVFRQICLPVFSSLLRSPRCCCNGSKNAALQSNCNCDWQNDVLADLLSLSSRSLFSSRNILRPFCLAYLTAPLQFLPLSLPHVMGLGHDTPNRGCSATKCVCLSFNVAS